MTSENTNKLELESAISALLEYGFAKARVKRTLRDILKVYNGNEAWPLIKENGYEVVLERLLSEDGSKQRVSQRKNVVQTPGQGGHKKEKKESNLDLDADNRGGHDYRQPVADISGNKERKKPDADNGGGLDCRHPVVDISGDKVKKEGNLDPDAGNGGRLDCRHPVTDISGDSFLFAAPVPEREDFDIILHQRNAWTRNGSNPTPAWLEISNASKKGAQQKYYHLHAIMQRLEKDCLKQAESVNSFSKQPECVDKLASKHVKDEKISCIGKRLQERHVDFCEVKTVKLEKIDCTGEYVEERHIRFLGQESNPAMLKTQKLAAVQHPQDAEKSNICSGLLQQERNPPILKTQNLADDLHTHYADTCNISFKQCPEKDDMVKGLKKRKWVLASDDYCENTTESVAASQIKQPRTHSTIQRTNNLPSTFCATERLDIARMSACKLTRRRDGGYNPMFSRLQKLKHAGAEASVSNNNQQESSLLNASQCGQAQLDLYRGTHTSQAADVPSRTEETQDNTPSQESPRLPPGFWEPPDPVPSPESPGLPPGFWEPCAGHTLQEPTSPGREEDYQDPCTSDESPRLPPGFSEPCDPVSSPDSPRLPPGFWEPPDSEPAHHDSFFQSHKSRGRSSSQSSPDLPPGFWKPLERAAGLGSSSGKHTFSTPPGLWASSGGEVSSEDSRGDEWSKNIAKRKGTPPKQVFIANIPEGYEGAELKLYSLVREVLEGFKSVPISATLPRKIQVTEDHAFVEFYCEAMAGIFMDAYHANASVLRIDGEQLVAARSLHLMKADIQLRHAVAQRLKGRVLDPCNVFYLGNVPSDWRNEERLSSHISTLLEGATNSRTSTSEKLCVYTIPDFSDVYVHIPSSVLAETFFLRCLSYKEHLEEISTSLFVCRNSSFLPRAARLSLGA